MNPFVAFLAVVFAQQPQPIRQANLVVEAWPGDERLARSLLASAQAGRPFPGLPADVLDSPPAIRILLAPDAARFDSITGGRTPDWGAGVALPAQGIIVLPGYSSQRGGVQALPRVLRHELAHVALQRYLGAARVPRWFSEGYAVWSAGQLDEGAGWILRLAFLFDRAPPLDSLALEWPERATDARVAYLLSASAVEYLHEHGGERVLRIFLEQWRRDGSFESALRSTYGLTSADLERLWGHTVRRRYGWLRFFAQASVIWLILTVIVVILYLIRRRRDRHKLANLRATDPPDRPAWWAGETEDQGETPSWEDPPREEPPA